MNFRLRAACGLFIGGVLLASLCPGRSGAEAADYAVLVMAPGGSSQWAKVVRKAVQRAELPYPYRIFLGTGDTADERQELQNDVSDLEAKGAHTIIVIPMLVSSFSEIARQWKYLLGAGVQPGFINNPLFAVERHATIRFAETLNDSSVVVEILLDRAQEVSRQPSEETVIVVSRGPTDEGDNDRWKQIVQNVADGIKQRGGYHAVEGVTLRDDAPLNAREQAIHALRSRVAEIGKANGRTVVVLLLLAPGGIEDKIALELRGLNYVLNTKALLPDARISNWIRSQLP